MIEKYKAWHKELNKWCEPLFFTIQDLMTVGFHLSVTDEDHYMSVSYKDIELVPWTGFDDARGNPICVGDFVEHCNANGNLGDL